MFQLEWSIVNEIRYSKNLLSLLCSSLPISMWLENIHAYMKGKERFLWLFIAQFIIQWMRWNEMKRVNHEKTRDCRPGMLSTMKQWKPWNVPRYKNNISCIRMVCVLFCCARGLFLKQHLFIVFFILRKTLFWFRSNISALLRLLETVCLLFTAAFLWKLFGSSSRRFVP